MKKITLCLFVAILFLQETLHAQYQLQKGHWIISHQLGGYSYTKKQYTEFEDGVPQEKSIYKEHGFEFSFSGPNWGGIDINSRKYDNGGTESKTSSGGIFFTPQVGYFIRNNLMIGALLVVGFETYKHDYAADEFGKGHDWELGIGPMLKYYFGSNAKRKPFAGFESQFRFGKEKEKDHYHADLSEYKSDQWWMVVTPYAGYAWLLGKRWIIDARVEYSYIKSIDKRTSWYYENGVLASYSPETDKTEGKFNSIGLGFGISYTF